MFVSNETETVTTKTRRFSSRIAADLAKKQQAEEESSLSSEQRHSKADDGDKSSTTKAKGRTQKRRRSVAAKPKTIDPYDFDDDEDDDDDDDKENRDPNASANRPSLLNKSAFSGQTPPPRSFLSSRPSVRFSDSVKANRRSMPKHSLTVFSPPLTAAAAANVVKPLPTAADEERRRSAQATIYLSLPAHLATGSLTPRVNKSIATVPVLASTPAAAVGIQQAPPRPLSLCAPPDGTEAQPMELFHTEDAHQTDSAGPNRRASGASGTSKGGWRRVGVSS